MNGNDANDVVHAKSHAFIMNGNSTGLISFIVRRLLIAGPLASCLHTFLFIGSASLFEFERFLKPNPLRTVSLSEKECNQGILVLFRFTFT